MGESLPDKIDFSLELSGLLSSMYGNTIRQTKENYIECSVRFHNAARIFGEV